MIELRDHVRWCVVDGVAFFLDLQRGEYSALNPRLTQMLALPKDGDDDDELRAALQNQGWLAEFHSTSRPLPTRSSLRTRPLRVPAVLIAFWCLLSCKLTLLLRGFSRAYAWAQRHQAIAVPQPSWLLKTRSIEEEISTFRAVETLVPNRRGPKDCLPRSLALFAFLKRRGHCVRHVIGVRRYPFAAHAWVEANGKPLLQPKSYGATPLANGGLRLQTTEFVPIATIG